MRESPAAGHGFSEKVFPFLVYYHALPFSGLSSEKFSDSCFFQKNSANHYHFLPFLLNSGLFCRRTAYAGAITAQPMLSINAYVNGEM